MDIRALLSNPKTNKNSLQLQIEIYENKGEHYLFVSEDNSTGATYKINTIEDISEKLKLYFDLV